MQTSTRSFPKRLRLVALTLVLMCLAVWGYRSVLENRYTLHTHCGVDELNADGRWFERVGGPLLSETGPPEGWGNPEQVGKLVVDGHAATFIDGEGHHETFTERVGATEPKTVCS